MEYGKKVAFIALIHSRGYASCQFYANGYLGTLTPDPKLLLEHRWQFSTNSQDIIDQTAQMTFPVEDGKEDGRKAHNGHGGKVDLAVKVSRTASRYGWPEQSLTHVLYRAVDDTPRNVQLRC